MNDIVSYFFGWHHDTHVGIGTDGGHDDTAFANQRGMLVSREGKIHNHVIHLGRTTDRFLYGSGGPQGGPGLGLDNDGSPVGIGTIEWRIRGRGR